MKRLSPILTRTAGTLAVLAGLLAWTGQAQILFSDNFNGPLDTSQWRIDNQPFESGSGTITATAGGGYLIFSGSDTNGYWGGSAIATRSTFNASPETNLIFTVERVSLTGSGTAWRSSIFITDATRTHFVHFGDDQGEGNWHYNREIGMAGDNPTGTGTAIPAFDQAPYNDGGDHTIKAVLDGQTVKLYLDDVLGAEVAFPYSTGIVFEIGSYARAIGDTVTATFGPVSVEAVQTVRFTSNTGSALNSTQILAGNTSTNIAVQIPDGQNATQPFTVNVTSSDPTVAVPVGATGDTLALTFPAGGPTRQTVPIQALSNGGATFTLQDSAGVSTANSLQVLVPYTSAGELLQDDFSGATYDAAKWQLDTNAFETGASDMTVGTTNGQLVISGGLTAQYWGGVALKTVQNYVATKDLSLVFEMDTPSLAYSGTAGRRGVFITTADRSQFVWFGQDDGETGWEVNSTSGGNPTGSGTAITAFSGMNDGNAHHLKLVADGSNVQIYLDGVYGGEFAFPVTSGIYFEIGAYARAEGDTVTAAYDNVDIYTKYPPITVTPPTVTLATNQFDQSVTVAISPAMINASAATVTVTSRDPSVAVPAGAVNGSLTLTFPAGGSPTNTFLIDPVGIGTTTFDITNTEGVAVVNGVNVAVTQPLETLLTDDFSESTIDTNLWRLDTKGLEPLSSVTNDSYLIVTNGTALVHAVSGGVGEAAGIWWGGLALATREQFTASPTAPVSFQIDRVAQSGTGAERRTAILIADATRQNWVMFSDDDLNGGWVVDQSSGTLRQVNTGIAAFADPKFNDLGDHQMKLLANGSTVKVYLDGVYGTEVPFPYSQGIIFEFGGYARSNPDSVTGTFDNALVTGPTPALVVSATNLVLQVGQTTNTEVTITVPPQIHQTATAHVTVTSSDPSVAVPAGGTGGSLTLSFPPGSPDEQTFQINALSKGIATFSFADDQGAPSTSTLQVIVPNPSPTLLFSDDFNSPTLSSSWDLNTDFKVEPWDSAAQTYVTTGGGILDINVTTTSNYWPGVLVLTTTNYHATLVDPLILDVDRLDDPGSGTGFRSGVYIYDATGTNFIWFGDDEGTSDNVGWGYNRNIGQPGDNPTGSATAIAAFNQTIYKDLGNHHIRIIANGQTVQLYLDGVFGTELPFPFSTGLRFGLMGAARAVGDTLATDFANFTISGSNAAVPAQLAVATQNGNVIVSWTASGTLQQADSVTGPWSDISTATSPYTVPAANLAQQKFYRLKQ